jgi:Ca2+-transporting ATPase
MKKQSNRWHAVKCEDVLRAFSTNRYKGLHSHDAAARRFRGRNDALWSTDLSDQHPSFFHQLCDYTTVLFVLAVILAALFSHASESLAILLLLVISVGIRALVILSTRKILRQNAKYTRPRCRVMRDGKCLYLFADRVVDGDIILLSTGDTVPADVRLISGDLVVSEVYLDDKRRQVQKRAGAELTEKTVWTERSNIVYATSTVLNGDGVGVVIATGENTLAYAQKGRVSFSKTEGSHMVRRGAELSRTVSFCMMVLCGIYLVIGIFAKRNPVPIDQLFLSSIALIVSSSSELLCTVVWGMMSEAMQRMSAEGSCIAKSDSVVEKLAMTEWLVIGGEHLLRTGELYIHSWCGGDIRFHEYAPDAAPAEEFLRVCSSIERCFPGSGSLSAGADAENRAEPQEIVSALKARRAWHTLPDIPPCTESVVCNGMITSLVAEENNLFAYVCGEIDDVIVCCSKVMTERGLQSITSAEVAAARAHARYCKARGIKTIAVAKRVSPLNHLDRPASVQNSMIFLGCVATDDPVDPEIRELLAHCRCGGIRVALLCEDPFSAEHVACVSGLVADGDTIHVCGIHQIDEGMSRTDGSNLLIRSSPGTGCNVIREMQKHSRNIVYLGDRITDLPVLKVCPVIFAEGNQKRPSDVVSRRADAILLRADSKREQCEASSVSSALKAISTCRCTAANIRWSILYLLLSQTLRCVLALFSLCTDMPLLSATQALLLGCVMDFLAVIAMAFQPNSPDALAVNRKRLKIPGWNSGVIAAVGIGILSGLCLSLAGLIVSRFFAVFDPAALAIMRLVGTILVSAVAMHLCAGRRSAKRGTKRKISLVYVVYLTVVGIMLGALAYSGIFGYCIKDWRVWTMFATPAIITCVMLIIYKNAQEN